MTIFLIFWIQINLVILRGHTIRCQTLFDFWLLSFECHLVLPCWKRERDSVCYVIVSPDTLALWLSIPCFLEQGLHCIFCLVLRNNPLVENSTRTKTHSKTTTMLPRCLPSPLLWNLKQSEIMFWCWTCFDGIAAEREVVSVFNTCTERPPPTHHVWASQKQIVQQRQKGGDFCRGWGDLEIHQEMFCWGDVFLCTWRIAE